MDEASCVSSFTANSYRDALNSSPVILNIKIPPNSRLVHTDSMFQFFRVYYRFNEGWICGPSHTFLGWR